MRETRTRRYSQNRLRYLGSFHWRAMLRKVTLLRLFQAIHALVEWKLHRTRCSSRPFAFRIEPAATCNLRCPLCSTTYRKFYAGDVRVMTLDLFRTILEKIRKHAWRITFYMEGEPMMNPRLFEMIELSARDRHSIHLVQHESDSYAREAIRSLVPITNRLDFGKPRWLPPSDVRNLPGERQSTGCSGWDRYDYGRGEGAIDSPIPTFK